MINFPTRAFRFKKNFYKLKWRGMLNAGLRNIETLSAMIEELSFSKRPN
jgi:hypothetical protein